VIQLGMGLVLILTICLGMALGVGSGYLVISSILKAFARKPESPKAAQVLAQHGVAGD